MSLCQQKRAEDLLLQSKKLWLSSRPTSIWKGSQYAC